MPGAPDQSRLAVGEVVARARPEMIPLTAQFSYFCVVPVADEDLKPYLHDPVAALPPALTGMLPPVGVILAPYLERANGRGVEIVTFERPADARYAYSARIQDEQGAVLIMAIKEEEAANYHYTFYREIAELVAGSERGEPLEAFARILREELKGEVHGEVDEQGWRLKQALVRRQSGVRKESKLFREYARQAFLDTLTLYLHGICCDIDVETGPRQLPSRWLRRRLELLQGLFPPPEGYAVFPEQLKAR
jgi:hypothetical protein